MEKQVDLYTFSAVVNTVVHEGITAFRKKKSRGVLSVQQHFAKQEAANGHRKGVQFVVRTKEDLQRQKGVRGFIVTSQEALLEEVNQISHWTPNVFRWGTYSDDKRKYIKGHAEENLQQINTYVIDVDTQQVDVAKLVVTSMQILNQTPTFILKTNQGFQLYFVLENPVFISNAHNFKSLRVAKRIATNLKHAFAEALPGVDKGCNDFGFFRMPNLENIVFENLENKIDYQDLITWSKSYTEKHNRSGLKLVHSQLAFPKATEQTWFQRLIQLTNIRGHQGQYGRNNAAFTLALACYSSGKEETEAFDLLDEFNSNLQSSISQRELNKVLKSAYSGKYQGANLDYIQGILETYENEHTHEHSTAFIFFGMGNRVFRKHKKARDERKYSHFTEWEMDLEAYLQNILSGQTFLEKSQRELAEELKMPFASLKKVLKQSQKIVSKVEGRGRNARTLFSTVALVVEQAIRYALIKKQEQKEQYLNFLASFSDAAFFITKKIMQIDSKWETQQTLTLFSLLENTHQTSKKLDLTAFETG
ncbi:primase C-terminal domain-containing protein [Listeria aquatica]|uniref:primase C-terminal domain-containing protein n=1 Tax=Listeria aquatica TaxID=1494960 RepID=UPI0031F57059